MDLTTETLNSYSEKIIELVVSFVPQIALAIIVLFIGLKIIKSLTKGFRNLLTKKEVDPSLIPFLSSVTNVLLKAMLVLSVMSMVGIEVTSFVAVLGAASLAIGLALQGSLSNFAGGVMILLFKPFKVGDVLEAQGVIGSVSAIQVFNTILKTFDNKTIILPNGALATSSMINYSTEETRIVEWVFGIGYDDDIDKARQVIEEVVFHDDRVLDQKEDGYFINVAELADSSVNFKVRAKVKSDDYWQVFFDKNEAIKKAFDASGISIPYPQQDVHVFQNKQ